MFFKNGVVAKITAQVDCKSVNRYQIKSLLGLISFVFVFLIRFSLVDGVVKETSKSECHTVICMKQYSDSDGVHTYSQLSIVCSL